MHAKEGPPGWVPCPCILPAVLKLRGRREMQNRGLSTTVIVLIILSIIIVIIIVAIIIFTVINIIIIVIITAVGIIVVIIVIISVDTIAFSSSRHDFPVSQVSTNYSNFNMLSCHVSRRRRLSSSSAPASSAAASSWYHCYCRSLPCCRFHRVFFGVDWINARAKHTCGCNFRFLALKVKLLS